MRSARARTERVVDRERQPRQRPRRARPRRARALTSASPECAALIGSAPQAAASAATMPNASGKVLGTTSASHAGSSSVELIVVETAREHDALGQGARGGQVARALVTVEAVEKRQQMAQRARLRAPLPRSPGSAISRAEQTPPTAREQPLKPSGSAEADDDEPRGGHALEHERPGGEQQVDALVDDQLADERDQPIARGIEALQRARRRRARRGRTRSSGVCCRRGRGAGRAQPSRQRRAARAARALRDRAARTARHPRPAGRGACARAATGRRAPPTGWRPCDESRRGPRARPRGPRGRSRRKRSGWGLTVYSSALP